jgi:GTP pyrophosphokinase
MTESQKINSAYRTLLKSAGSTLGPGDTRKIRRALELAIEACTGKSILTGKPEIEHALSVASIVAGEMGLEPPQS